MSYRATDSKYGAPVEKLDKNTGEVLAVYENTKQASESTGINISCIRHCIKGKYKTAGGYKWRYVEDEKI